MNTGPEPLSRSAKVWRGLLWPLVLSSAGTENGPEAALPEPTPVNSVRANTALWDNLSPETQRRAEHTVAMMAERFQIPAEQFRLVASESHSGQRLVTAVYGGPALDLGSRDWNTIFGRGNYFQFVLSYKVATPDGPTERFRADARELTQGAYKALVEDTRTNGLPLPDTELQNGLQPKVWLTGERATNRWANYAFVDYNGDVIVGAFSRERSDREMRFRPASIIQEG